MMRVQSRQSAEKNNWQKNPNVVKKSDIATTIILYIFWASNDPRDYFRLEPARTLLDFLLWRGPQEEVDVCQ